MLPPTRVVAPAGGDDLARQRGSRRLAVRSGDGDDLAFQVARRQFDFANDGDAGLPRLQQLRHVGGHARADDDQFLLVEGALAVISGLDHDAAVEQAAVSRDAVPPPTWYRRQRRARRGPPETERWRFPICPARPPVRACLLHPWKVPSEGSLCHVCRAASATSTW